MNDTQNSYVISILEKLYNTNKRIRIFSGNTETGKNWNEENDVMGYVGKSTGDNKIFLLVNNSRSKGGIAISINSILCIMNTSNSQIIYKHPLYKSDIWNILDCSVYCNNELYAITQTPEKAKKLIDFMTGKRFAK